MADWQLFGIKVVYLEELISTFRRDSVWIDTDNEKDFEDFKK